MKSIMSLLGIVLIIFGIGVFVYKGYTYTTQEKVLEVGNLQVTAEQEKTVYFPPIAGGIALVAGLVLVIAGRKK